MHSTLSIGYEPLGSSADHYSDSGWSNHEHRPAQTTRRAEGHASPPMSYRTFKGATVDEAKRAMRRALGPDGVILATRRRPDGSVELRAIKKGEPLQHESSGGFGGIFGRKKPQEPAPAPSFGGLNEPRVREERNSPSSRGAGSRDHTPEPERVDESPLGSLRGDFSRKLSRDQASNDPLFQAWDQKLSRHGLTPRLIRALVDEAHEFGGRGDEVDQLAFALSRTLRFAPLNIMRDVPIMLIGQTGAGKTSSAAKIAAGAAAQGGRLAFISADVGRAGAVEQMQTYADALDTRFWAVEEPRQVAQIMRQERPREGIILDTPGVSPFASADVQAVRAFREALGAEMVLVIPASGDVSEHADWVSAFADIGVRRCIITKFDASRRIGAAISACYQAGMALAYFSEAPFIADGLIEAQPEYLARRLLMDVPGRLSRGR